MMDCFPDFCLACDKQAVESLYCSQACRLADLEKAGSASTSPNIPSTFSCASLDWKPSHLGSGSLFCLTPALDFDRHKLGLGDQPRLDFLHDDEHYHEPSLVHSPHRRYRVTASQSASPRRILSASSSHTSLNSAISGVTTPTHSGLSDQARKELENYESSFDNVREIRRRSIHT